MPHVVDVDWRLDYYMKVGRLTNIIGNPWKHSALYA